MKTKLIDLLGLTNMANDIMDWVNAKFQRKVDGKGLSTNDYDDTAKAKVDAIPDDPKYTDTTYEAGDGISIEGNVISATGGGGGGEENVIETVKVNGMALTPDSEKAVDVEVPTKTSDLNNDSGFITTETDPTVPSWAKQPNKPSYNYSEIGNTPDLSGFITKSVNDLTNYYLKSETYTKDEVAALIGAIQQFHYKIYPTLPASGENNVLYLIGPIGSGSDRYEEYVYSNGFFTKIGDTSIDLSGYVTTSALNTALADYTTTANLTTLLAGKQDTISDLSTIRSGASLGATAYQKPSTGIPASDLASGVIPQPEVFVAEYGVTTYEELRAAIDAHKVIICEGQYGRLRYISENNTYIIFCSTFSTSIMTYNYSKSQNRWTGYSSQIVELSSNKVSTIVGNETNTTKYPNTKAVADYVVNKADKTSVVTLTGSSVTQEMVDNTIYQGTALSSLTITIPNSITSDYISQINFTSGSTATTLTAPNTIVWFGDDLTNNVFVPTTDKQYVVMLYYDGVNVRGVVQSYASQQNS